MVPKEESLEGAVAALGMQIGEFTKACLKVDRSCITVTFSL